MPDDADDQPAAPGGPEGPLDRDDDAPDLGVDGPNDPEPEDATEDEPFAPGRSRAVVSLSADEAAIADAVSLLSGPALELPAERPTPEALEADWSPAARAGLEDLLADLDGKPLGLTISGGGSLGSFEVGVLRFLYDHVRVDPVALSGNSAGALNAAKLAHGVVPGRERPIDGIERVWRALRINPDMWEPEPWLERIIASAQWASSIRGQVGDISNATNAVRVAVRVVGSLVRRPEETDGTFDAIKDALNAQSLLTLTPVTAMIRDELDPARLATSGIKLRMGVVSLEAGELRYVTEKGELHDRHDRPLGLDPVDVGDGILASASIPVAFPPVLLAGEHYVDGGAREILPLQVMVEHLGVERTIAISASSPGIERRESFAEKSVVDILRRVSAEIASNETLRKELDPPGGWPTGVRLVIPEFDVHDAMTIDPALIAISIDYGWMRAADQLLGLDDECHALSTEIARTRIDLRKLAGPLPSLFGGLDPDAPPTPGWHDGELTLTARLREQTQARRALGAPLPPSLLAWLEG